MTLAEFLLARIAEDEDVATNWLRFEVRDGVPGNYAIPDRVRAECEAKRRIIELHSDGGKDWNGERFVHFCHSCRTPWPCLTLRALALPYADHPDYREEWRP